MHTSAPNRLVQPLSQVIVAAFPSLIFVLLLPNRGKLFSFFSFGGGGGGGGISSDIRIENYFYGKASAEQ